jgi:hypothetical protein
MSGPVGRSYRLRAVEAEEGLDDDAAQTVSPEEVGVERFMIAWTCP